MGIGNVLALTQVTGYLLSIIMVLFVIPPMSKNLHQFSGHCLLYAFGKYDSYGKFRVEKWGPSATCGYALFIGLVTFFVSLWQTLRLSVHLLKNTDSSFLGAFVSTINNVVMFILLLGSASSITAGYNVWCNHVENSPHGEITCGSASIIENIWPTTKDYKPFGFAIQIGILQFGMWMNTLIWFVEIFLSSYKLWIYHQQESIFRSLSRERQRLLNNYDPPEL